MARRVRPPQVAPDLRRPARAGRAAQRELHREAGAPADRPRETEEPSAQVEVPRDEVERRAMEARALAARVEQARVEQVVEQAQVEQEAAADPAEAPVEREAAADPAEARVAPSTRGLAANSQRSMRTRTSSALRL